MHISNLRKKLKELSGKEFIETSRGQGYRIAREGESY
ncbi:MAG: helix-turn-helix domain-containing protein [Oscillospiraceae bacterium]